MKNSAKSKVTSQYSCNSEGHIEAVVTVIKVGGIEVLFGASNSEKLELVMRALEDAKFIPSAEPLPGIRFSMWVPEKFEDVCLKPRPTPLMKAKAKRKATIAAKAAKKAGP